MSDKATAPNRLKPLYETPKPGSEILLIEEEATITQGRIEALGKVRIKQEWSPMRLNWDFQGTGLEDIVLGEVEISAKSFKATGRSFNRGKHRITGYLKSNVDVGTNHRLDRLTFHLPNYPNVSDGWEYRGEAEDGGITANAQRSEVILEADGWRITLQPHRRVTTLLRNSVRSQKTVLTGVGEIRRANGKQFKKKEAQPLLDALRIFLSFALAHWSPPILVVGSNRVSEKSCQSWVNYDLGALTYARGWLHPSHGQSLSSAFPGFMALWANENWHEPLELAVSWLIEASRLTDEGGSRPRAKAESEYCGLACSKGATDSCKVGAMGSIPIRSTETTGSWSNGKTPPWRGGNPSSTLGGSTNITPTAHLFLSTAWFACRFLGNSCSWWRGARNPLTSWIGPSRITKPTRSRRLWEGSEGRENE